MSLYFSAVWSMQLLSTLLFVAQSVYGLGTACTAPLGSGTSPASDPYWLQTIPKRGKSAFNPDTSYTVFRNVKDYGARGDGVTDDTAAINAAMATGNRCGNKCDSSTLTPAVVYFPPGTYVISSPIVSWYYSQMIGDAKNLPVIMAASNWEGMALIDADPYTSDGQWYTNQNNFFRSVRNFVLDCRRVAPSRGCTGLHWQVSQATSLINVRVEMSREPGNQHQGIFMENGSGGFMGDLVFNGGKLGMWIGNQQFTVRNIKIDGADVGMYAGWNWGWTFQRLTITNCRIGFQIATGGTTQETQTVGGEVIVDADIQNTPIFIQTTTSQRNSFGGSLVLDNIRLTNVPVAVAEASGFTVLAGGTRTITSWAQGNIYSGTNPNPTYVQRALTPPSKPGVLLENGQIVSRSKPTYANYAVSQFSSAKEFGAIGNGQADDTAVLQRWINTWWGCKLLYLDAGTYMVSDTITIPAGTQILGEAWSQILGYGSRFQDYNNPRVVVKVGEIGSSGVTEVSDIVFGTRGPAAGAIVVQWNVRDASGRQGSAAAWDTHVRIGGTAGTNLGDQECLKLRDNGNRCFAAFLGFHLTSQASAYLEGLWVWLADHALDPGHQQITIFSGRGLLSESQGPVWLIGTGSEHHVLYQYSFVNAANHYGGLMQTETPYYQPAPAPPNPFPLNSSWKDPSFNGEVAAWSLWVQNSQGILVYGAGFYSFFTNYAQTCLTTWSCQRQIVNIDSASSVYIYQLSTVGTTYQLSVNLNPIINQSRNRNGFASTVTAWFKNSVLTRRDMLSRPLLA